MPASSSSSSPSSASDTTAAAAATGHLSPLVAAAMAAAKASRLTENQRPQREGVEEVDDEIVLASGISSKRRRPLGSLLDPSSGAMEIHSMRVKPSAAFALYPGSRFVGEQRSDRASYTVSVQLQHVDMKESTLCGYLTISNLTDEFPEMTTYFEAEIVGPRYPFYTRKWGADEMVDRQHWMRFPSFHQYEPVFNRDDYVHSFENKDHIFMRWKEHFLVPDHKVRNIAGASFAGFYYICFDSVNQTITGYYYHQNSEWFQHLILSHVEEKSFGSFEFR